MGDTRIREWVPGDREYVLATWTQSAAPKRPTPWYWAAQKALIDVLTTRGTVRVLCPTEYPSMILAWACVEGSCVHWVYTKRPYRGVGFARELVKNCDTRSAGKVRVDWLRYEPKRLEHEVDKR